METIAKGASREKPAQRGEQRAAGKASRIGAATRYDFGGGVLTPYGGCCRLVPFLIWLCTLRVHNLGRKKMGGTALRALLLSRCPAICNNNSFENEKNRFGY